jgi:hypothetical protein
MVDKKEEYYNRILNSYIEQLEKEIPDLKDILKEEEENSIDKELFKGMIERGEITLTNSGLQRVVNIATRDIAAKILQWYAKTKNEEFADFIGITRTRNGRTR